jgi:hypothetical protein
MAGCRTEECGWAAGLHGDATVQTPRLAPWKRRELDTSEAGANSDYADFGLTVFAIFGDAKVFTLTSLAEYAES